MRILLPATLCCTLSLFASTPSGAQTAVAHQVPGGSDADEEVDGPLPRWGNGAPESLPPNESLEPFTLGGSALMPPTSGVIEAFPEYGPADGIVFRYSSVAWPDVVADCVAAITGDPTKNDKAYVVVANATVQATATTHFTTAGADLSKVEFARVPSNSIWLTDYGPTFILLDGSRAIVDAHYYLLDRVKDNFVPTRLGEDHFEIPVFHMGMRTSARGNLLVGPNRSAFISTITEYYNQDFSPQYIAQQFQDYQGLDTLHVFPHLPPSVDLTGHIDMWMCLVDDTTVIISEFAPGSDATAIQITENAASYLAGLGFTVFRVPDSVGAHSGSSFAAHFTYTNCVRVNDRFFIPSYGDGDPTRVRDDQDALLAFQSAAPTCQIIQIPCYDIIWAAGALHCITMTVPVRTDPTPAVNVVSPEGGELLASGSTHEITWTATDDVAVTGIDLFYSLDGGASFPHQIATGLENDSREEWIVPVLPDPVDLARVKVVAHDGSGTPGEGTSAADFELGNYSRRLYDFSTGAGLDRWGWGMETGDWSELDGVRYPATVDQEVDQLDPAAYTLLAASDASGGDTDPNRYVGPMPEVGHESTHIFELTIQEAPSLIQDIGIHWEGYGDYCSHVEVYLWDHVAGNWGDGAGGVGNNAYLANYAGNRDHHFEGHVRQDFDRYVDGAGKLAMLVYDDRARQRTFHDYLAIEITWDPIPAGTGYCFGDPGSGTPCPCNNDNDGSAPGSGCANGVFASGARLTGNGVASVSADSLTLAATGLEPLNSSLYFQADNNLSPGSAWGDGLRCAGGQLKRLGVEFADSNGSSDTSGFPEPISVKAGNVAAGDTRYYQCWYRNPAGSPCGADFNTSNGLIITWAP